MRAGRFTALICILLLLSVGVSSAEKATLHAARLHRQGGTIHMAHFDVTLDGRLLTASRAVYHPKTGVIELSGNVRLQFGPNVRTFPG